MSSSLNISGSLLGSLVMETGFDTTCYLTSSTSLFADFVGSSGLSVFSFFHIACSSKVSAVCMRGGTTSFDSTLACLFCGGASL